ncbi:DNA-binding LacI/PurR family transcriptional regulator [Psychromicrobium silvestre]|uniref:DNA-binding LacI/PurR family transcriptional regulator n=1 Tax=Psychromicrobium silvestre TaxID=1645614 RepID=A0A7Y9LV33_9MICC|nr:LacI family DNA-binding transcriptional regulator [Psychromicrobium silvestre]NYE96158.1 DNA-binding LacI/PurR family transcriptional regulator [Psychromicrobium silvestre]
MKKSPTAAPTIRDVAEAAGVATSTVSRALSNPERVSVRTRKLVEQVAAELNYVPSSQARALSSGRTGAIAVLVPDATNPFYFDIIRGSQHQLKAAGYTQLLVDTEESAEVEAEALNKLRQSCDGVVLAASRLSDEQILGVVEQTPAVTINRGVPGVPTVIIDTPQSVGQALEHLLSLGHQHIAYLAGPVGSWSNARRLIAFEEQASRLGLRISKLGPFAPKTTSGAAAADAALHSGASACVVFNDLIAIGMLQRFAARGVRVPEDISVIGCDDIFGADFCNPPLTTITAPIEQAGRVAISMLLSRVRPFDQGLGERGVSRTLGVLPTHLTVRQSTGPARS